MAPSPERRSQALQGRGEASKLQCADADSRSFTNPQGREGLSGSLHFARAAARERKHRSENLLMFLNRCTSQVWLGCARLFMSFADGHTASNAPDLF